MAGYALGISRGLNVNDEGLGLAGADRVIHGDLPYRNFWAIYCPGGYYLVGGLFLLFGPSVIAARGRSLEDAVRYIDEQATSDERIFVACPPRSDPSQ
jgi:hypothetical protein